MEDLAGLDDGEPFRIDARVFHRAGVDGTHHVEEGVEVFLEPEGNGCAPEGCRTLLLTDGERERLDESYAFLLDGLHVDPENPTHHPVIKAVC